MFLKNTRTLALLLLVLGLAGCNSPERKIIGKWNPEGETNEIIYEFRRGGGVTAGKQPGKYTFDGTRMKLQTQTATFMYEVEFAGDDRMIWREGSGTRTELRRVE
ncbi:hypothetical protein BH20VER1_BH20VER1_10160 [soil metagenome]